MTELVITDLKKRVVFPAGEQIKFLEKAREQLGLSWPLFTERIGVNRRTMNDWKREQYSLPLEALEKIVAESGIKAPSKVELKDRYWYTTVAGQAGGVATLKKYGLVGGVPSYRKMRWREWWDREGQYTSVMASPRPIKKPQFSTKLAEFIGIMMGDGGITKRQVTVTLNKEDDRLYVLYVTKLIKGLFGVEPSLYTKNNGEKAVNIVVSRTRLVKFCSTIGLKIGNKIKQNLDIPEWVQSKKPFLLACLRGLVDTDGCIFQETHRIKGKLYSYPRLAFTSASPSLRYSVTVALESVGLNPKLRTKRNVQLEDRLEIEKYFRVVGTSNPKHRKRFNKFIGGVG
ncbi:MAG: LAGLIDADG family homing endonuclease [Patescibacteria group bacterium]